MQAFGRPSVVLQNQTFLNRAGRAVRSPEGDVRVRAGTHRRAWGRSSRTPVAGCMHRPGHTPDRDTSIRLLPAPWCMAARRDARGARYTLGHHRYRRTYRYRAGRFGARTGMLARPSSWCRPFPGGTCPHMPGKNRRRRAVLRVRSGTRMCRSRRASRQDNCRHMLESYCHRLVAVARTHILPDSARRHPMPSDIGLRRRQSHPDRRGGRRAPPVPDSSSTPPSHRGTHSHVRTFR